MEKYAYETLAFDRGSVREKDKNGFLHVKISPLTRVQVAPYYGREIPGYEKLGLSRDKIYYGYRPESELKKESTINSVNGIPIQLRHHADFADNPAKDTRIGATGTEAEFKTPFLMNSLHFFDKKAIDLIESDAMKELSLAYRYTPDFNSPGEINGQKYDFTMRDLSGNHLALVEKGRAGHEVLVYDSEINPGGIMDDMALDGMSLEQLKKLVGKVAAAIDKLQAGEKPEKAKEVITETEEEEVVSDKCGGGKKAGKVASDKCGPKKAKAAKDTDTVEEEETAEIETEDKKEKPVSRKEEKADPELAEGEEIVKVEEVRKPKGKKVEAEVEEEETEEETEEPETEEEEESEEEEAEETEVEEDEQEVEEVEEKPAKKGNQGMRSDLAALKAAGLESAPDTVKHAFVSGYKSYARRLAEKNAAEENKGMASDNAPDEKAIRAKVIAEYKAAQEVKPVLGEIDVAAYDSAEDIYQAACNKLDLRCDKVSARDVYQNFRKRKTETKKTAVVQCSGSLGKFLND